jgi:PAS domain-containing protein
MTSNPETSPLRIVREGDPGQPLKVFCGHCGRQPEGDARQATGSRVCSKCGMGLLLEAPGDIAPNPSDPFLVVDGALSVCAVSREAERLLGVAETDVINRHIAELLLPADAETGNESLATLLAWGARGESPPNHVVVRPTNTFGVRYWARVGPCGPPTAALLVLADAR